AALIAVDEIIAVSADQHVVSTAATNGVIASAAIDGELDMPAGQRRSVDRVAAAKTVDNEGVVRTFRTLDRHLRRQAGDQDGGAIAGDVNFFAATRAGPDARREVVINLRNVGIAQVIDGDGVGAPESPELNVLDIVEIHADAGNIAGEQRVPALGGDVDGFVDIRT